MGKGHAANCQQEEVTSLLFTFPRYSHWCCLVCFKQTLVRLHGQYGSFGTAFTLFALWCGVKQAKTGGLGSQVNPGAAHLHVWMQTDYPARKWFPFSVLANQWARISSSSFFFSSWSAVILGNIASMYCTQYFSLLASRTFRKIKASQPCVKH